MNIKKYLMLGAVVAGLSMTSCIGDLDLQPNDPNLWDTNSNEFIANSLMGCYTVMAVSGQDGPGSSIISGLDNGTGQYTRALFMMNEFTTDECIWIWKDDGVFDLVTNTFNTNNGNIYGTYSRLYAHIAVCNQFLYDTAQKADDPEVAEYRAEARALRAMSYYWALDVFRNPTFVLEPNVDNPPQTTALDLYKWLEGELVDIVDNSALAEKPLYGRVGKDGAEALLARLYLNAETYTDGAVKDGWKKCATRCQNIIDRHDTDGYHGLVANYLWLFGAENNIYMPGGVSINEILWGIAYDSNHVRTYGGTTFLVAGAIKDGKGMASANYGFGDQWACMKATQQFSEHFTTEPTDTRWALWVMGDVEGLNDKGEPETYTYTIENEEFTTWGSGYIPVKWTNLYEGNTYRNIFDDPANHNYPQFAQCDLALIRLADVYLMMAECALHPESGVTAADGVKYANYVRNRASISDWGVNDLTADNVLAERSRELYWELTRRSDLVRFGKMAGNGQALWAWKGNVKEGNGVDVKYNYMPIPAQIMAAQPDYKQNPNW